MARSEFAFLFAPVKKAAKVRKAPIKAIKVGVSVILSVDGKTYTVEERDTRFPNAWFLTNAHGKRCSFSRDMLKVV